MSASVIGQSSRFAPSMSPYVERARNSYSWKRGHAPAQWAVVPPTILHVHVGRLGKSFDTRHVPDVVRLSSHAIWPNAFHSSLTSSSRVISGPASSSTTLTPRWHSSLASVPPPAPEPTTTTTSSSALSNRVMAALLSGRGFGEPVQVVEAPVEVASLVERGALVAE